jgi:hypothetical protein
MPARDVALALVRAVTATELTRRDLLAGLLTVSVRPEAGRLAGAFTT